MGVPCIWVYESSIADNVALNGSGGGIQATSLNTNSFYGCTISGNTCSGWGGGMYFYTAVTGIIVNCTVVSNVARGAVDLYSGGGGVNAYFAGTGSGLAIRNSTIAGNSISNGVGGGVYQYGTLDIESTIIAGNVAASGNGQDYRNRAGSFTERYNILGNNAESGWTAGQPNANNSYVGTSALPINPGLLPLANNGGRTWTCAIGFDSPAMDRGSNPLGLTTDQRGVYYSRTKHGRADIGAFELGAGPAKGTVVTFR